jgi:site-specific recombinase XerD
MVDKYPGKVARRRWISRHKFFQTLGREAGVPEMGYPCLGHAVASKMAAQGVPLIEMQKCLGHEPAATADIYLQSLGHNSLRAAAEALDDESVAPGATDFAAGGSHQT